MSIDMATGASQVRLLDDVSIEDHLRAEDRRVYLLGLFTLRNWVGGCQQSETDDELGQREENEA